MLIDLLVSLSCGKPLTRRPHFTYVMTICLHSMLYNQTESEEVGYLGSNRLASMLCQAILTVLSLLHFILLR